MAEHNPGDPPVPLGNRPAPSTPLSPLSFSSSVHLSIPFLRLFSCKTEFLSYLLLCLVKMPFIPPVPSSSSIPPSSFSVSRPPPVTGTGTGITTTTSPPPLQVTPVRAGKTNFTSNPVREHLTFNRQLGRKSQPHSRLPTIRGRGAGSSGIQVEGRNPWLPSHRLPLTGHRLPVMSQRLPLRSPPSGNGSTGGSSSFPASSSGELVTQGAALEQDSPSPRQVPMKSDPEEEREQEEEDEEEEEGRFTLTITPETVLLLQRRKAEDLRASRMGTGTESSEKLQASRMGTRTGRSALVETRLRSSNSNIAIPKRTPVTSRRGNSGNSGTTGPLDSIRSGSNGVRAGKVNGDISHLLKISLLNDHYKYDDVEYEEEDGQMDQRTAMKCTEWLRGLETATG